MHTHKQKTNYPLVGMCGHAIGMTIPIVEWHYINSIMPSNVLLPPPSLGRIFRFGIVGSIVYIGFYELLQVNKHS